MAPVEEKRGAHLKKGAYTGKPRGRKLGSTLKGGGCPSAKSLEDCWKPKPKKRGGAKGRGRPPKVKKAEK